MAAETSPQAAFAPESPIRYTCTVVATLAMITRAESAQYNRGSVTLFRVSLRWMTLTASAGWARSATVDVEALLRQADADMYRHKSR